MRYSFFLKYHFMLKVVNRTLFYYYCIDYSRDEIESNFLMIIYPLR